MQEAIGSNPIFSTRDSVIDMLEQEKTFFPPPISDVGSAEREAENERK